MTRPTTSEADMSAHDARQTPFMAVHLFLERAGQMLWLERTGTGWMDGHFSVVAGHVEWGESAVEAMIREASEEVGVVCTPSDLSHIMTMHRDSDTERLDLFFAARRWDGEPRNLEPNKCAGLVWASPDASPSPCVPYVAAAVAGWRRGVTYIEHGWRSERG